jgi:hypothetical protein
VTTDGLNIGIDILDIPVVVLDVPPMLEVRSPAVSQRVRSKQTLSLEAFAYDLDTGNLDGDKVTWSSDRDGLLGTGDQLSVTGLSPGGHSITVTAQGKRGTATRIVPIVVL